MTRCAAPTLEQARVRIAVLQGQLNEAGATLRPPPPEPTTCCGRGCNGCVWEGYYSALAYWYEDAEALLTNGKAANRPTKTARGH